MTKLTLAQADTIIDTALATAKKKNLKPMSVAVLDDGGHVKAFKKQDGSSLMRFEIAFGKAWGSLGIGRSSGVIAQMADERPHFVASLMAASGGRIVPVQGGVIIRDAQGEIVGAVGVTGDTSQNDEACAVAGIEAAGFKAEV